MKRLFLISLLLLFVNQLKAEPVDIWGRLVYEDGHGVAGALVTLEDYYTKEVFYDTTDINGYYSLGSTTSSVSETATISVEMHSLITNSVGRSCNFYFFDSKQIDKATVYNILGQKVSSVDLDHELFAAQKMWSNGGFWNGNSTAGFPVANGTYFIAVMTTKGIQAVKFQKNGVGKFTTPIPISRIEIERYMESTSFAESFIPGKVYPESETNLAYYMIEYEPLFDGDKFKEVEAIPEILFRSGVNSIEHTVESVFQDSLKILFIGNSYTHNNGVNLYLTGLFESANPDLFIDIQRSTQGGWGLENHWFYEGTQSKLNNTAWNLVVLQDLSTGPVYHPETTLQYAQLFNDSIEELGAETVFYMTWAREYDPDMIIPISSLYTSMGISMDALVSPVGLAWQNALEEDPGIDLYVEDGSHPTIYGTYLAACVFYSTIFHKSPERIFYGSEFMDRSIKIFLQRIAWETVREYNDL